MIRKRKIAKSKATGPQARARNTPPTYDLYRTLPNQSYEQRPSSRRPMQPKPKKQGKPRWKRILRTIAIILIILVVTIGGFLGYKAVRDFGWSNLYGLFHHTKLKGEDVGRVNILLAGNSADDPGHNGGQLTDSIMLVSIDTQNDKAFMISIPRDLYVHIPNNGYAKINEAYEDGQAQHFSESGYAPGGMGLLEETVSQKFGVPIDYYALVNYSAFRDAVNAVGGITVNIQSDSPSGLYDPSIDWTTHGPLVHLSNGPHNLNGQQALDLARARGDAYGAYGFPRGDFDRTMHQRQMLTALAAKALSAGVIANPLKVGSLFDAISHNVQTDFHLNEARRLNDIMKKIPQSSIQSASLNSADFNGQKDYNLLTSYATPYGQSALIPAAGIDNYAQIQSYVNQLESKY
ncbi:MAG TPA: LCP family protein [Candidatus Saccharimonadales bacterium]|nr:LCP family protein [Candidatus Saccharimonadales bacterium]